MTDLHEQEIADQIDREIVRRDGLLGLVVCLSATVGLVIASILTFVGPG